jgi:hypothetical protein
LLQSPLPAFLEPFYARRDDVEGMGRSRRALRTPAGLHDLHGAVCLNEAGTLRLPMVQSMIIDGLRRMRAVAIGPTT